MINSALIEKYFSNKLSNKEREDFNLLYKNNIEFKAEVNFLKNVKLVSENEDAANFKKKLMVFEEAKTNKSNKWLKSISAVAAVLLIAFCAHFLINSNVNEDQLFTTYFEPSKNVSAPIVRSETNETLLNKAFIAYNETSYNQAVTLFKKAYEESKNSELLFYEANAFLALNKPETAIEKFKEHIKFNDDLTNRSHWYLALAYLKIKNIENAKQELITFISSCENFKIEEAKSLLNKLD